MPFLYIEEARACQPHFVLFFCETKIGNNFSMWCGIFRNFFYIHKEGIRAQSRSFTLQQRRYMLTLLNAENVENDFEFLYIWSCVSKVVT